MRNRKISQKAAILDYLTKKKKISQLQALRSFGCMRLADVVFKLRNEGHVIRTTWRQQGDAKYAVYRLEVLADGTKIK